MRFCIACRPDKHAMPWVSATEIEFQRNGRGAVADDHCGHHLVHQYTLAGMWLMAGRVDHERGAEHRRLVVVSHHYIP